MFTLHKNRILSELYYTKITELHETDYIKFNLQNINNRLH